MRPIPQQLKSELQADPYYKQCAVRKYKPGMCDGRITWEHAIIYAGKQLNRKWAIIPICAYHHSVDEHQDGPGLDKELNIYIALSRASDTDLLEISKAVDYKAMRARLAHKYDHR